MDLPCEMIGPIASRGWSVPEFLRIRKPIATCDFSGEGPDPLSPSVSALEMQSNLNLHCLHML